MYDGLYGHGGQDTHIRLSTGFFVENMLKPVLNILVQTSSYSPKTKCMHIHVQQTYGLNVGCTGGDSFSMKCFGK